MSNLIGNENGRAGKVGAPADAREKSSGEFKSATLSDRAAADRSAGPSFPDPRGLAPHAAAGHELLALHAAGDRDRRGRPLGKSPAGSGWRTRLPLSLDEAEAHMALGGNVGARLRATDLVVDADPRNYRPGDDALARLRADFRLPDCPTVETGGGGFHLYMRKPEGAEVVGSLPDYPGVEFKSLGRQVVAAGSVHPDTGRLYAWDPLDGDPSTAPDAPDALLDAIRRPDRESATSKAGEHSPEELALLLGGLDARDYGTNDLWFPIAAAAHHATAGLGEDEFVAWCETDPEFADDGERVRKRWASLSWDKSGRAYTARTIYRELHKAGRGDLVEAAWPPSIAATTLVHMREPLRAAQEMGVAAALALLVQLPLSLLSIAAHPVALAMVLWGLADHSLWFTARDPVRDALLAIEAWTMCLGYAAALALSAAVLFRRPQPGLGLWLLPLLPAYWLLLAWALAVGLVDLALRPHRWAKTDHGAAARPEGAAPTPAPSGRVTRHDAGIE